MFTDVVHNQLYVTTNYGRDIGRIDLNFTPKDVSFHELQPSVFVVLDKNNDLWITENFGQSFRLVEIFVRGFYWMKGNDEQYKLIVQKSNSNETSDILYLDQLYSNGSIVVYDTDIVDCSVKDDYLFTTKLTGDDELELQISYKFDKKIKCHFLSALPQKGYFVVDVTSNRILIVVSHASTVSHLYVSEIFDSSKDQLEFSLSLENVLCYFPNKTWHNTWLR